MKIYQGRRSNGQALVEVNGQLLPHRFDQWLHSLGGFEWGYCGSGPAQLALALLADCLAAGDEAVRLHQDFKSVVLASLPHAGWTLTDEQIRHAAESLASESNGNDSAGMRAL